MRVIAGEAKGRRLRAAPGLRPTGDRVKEALFATLGARVAGARVLDLYAGAGALGIEALSRGAASATFVDRDLAAAAAMEANLSSTGLADRATVVRAPVERFVREGPGLPFDLVLADPPYAGGVPAAVLDSLAARLPSGATIVLEEPTRGPRPAPPAGLAVTAERRYGDTTLRYLAVGGA